MRLLPKRKFEMHPNYNYENNRFKFHWFPFFESSSITGLRAAHVYTSIVAVAVCDATAAQ